MFSASSSLTYKSQNYLSPILGHSGKIIMGVAAAIFVLNIPCRFFKLVTPALLIVSAIMLLWVLCFGEKTNDAGRWISLFGLKFQPSEIAKGTLVLVTAQILSAMQREDGADKRAFKFILIVVIPFIILIGLENLSTAALIMVVIFLMMFIGRVPFVQLGKMMAGGALVIVLFIGLVYMAGSMETNDETAETQTESVANGDTDGERRQRQDREEYEERSPAPLRYVEEPYRQEAQLETRGSAGLRPRQRCAGGTCEHRHREQQHHRQGSRTVYRA